MQLRALFLDRDGVINQNHGYVCEQANFDFIDGIFDVVLYAQNLKYKLIVITNQAGIGRGYYNEDQFHNLSRWMCEQFEVAGSPISKVYFSPYHPTAGVGMYLKDDYSRKPHPGMILQAQQDFDIDLSASVLIGDQVTDIQAGVAAGVGTNLLFSQVKPMQLNGIKYALIKHLSEAIPYLQQNF